MRSKRIVLNALLVLAGGIFAAAQTGGNFTIRDATLEGSGHVSSGGVFVSEVRLGQGLAGQPISGGNFAVAGGFYPAPPTQPPPVTPPDAPTELSARPIAATQVELTWTDGSGNEEGFAIERCQLKKNCMNFEEVARVDAGVTMYMDTDPKPETLYRYRVRAFNAAGNSGYSNIVTVKTPKK